jgi:signal transduction histidine kinase
MLEQESETERRFSRTLLEFQEAERTRIAGELHDSLAQTLAIAKNKALLGIRSAHDPLYAGREFAEISATLSAAMEEVRGIAHNLRPYQLDRLGVTRAILSLAGTVNASTPLRITAEIENVDRLFTPEMGTMVYRIIQEAVNNVLTHSGAGDASIAVRRSAQDVVITIRDSGRGFKLDRRAGLDAAGFGLSGIARRARLLGGTAAVESSPGAGTSVCVTIPLPVISQEV